MAKARHSAAGLSRLFDGAATPIYVLDDERTIVFCNAACASWLEIAAEDLTGLRCDYHSSAPADSKEQLAALLCPPPQVFAGERVSAPLSPRTNATALLTEFVPIAGETGETQLVLAIAGLAAIPADSAEPDSLWHEAVSRFRRTQVARYRVDRLIGETPITARAREQVALAVDCEASVLLVGPPGSGKDHIVKTIHYRGGKPFGPLVPLACATLGADLLVSTLEAAIKSHPKSPTGSAPSGTLLLSEIDELPVDAHTEFARLICARNTGLRLIATTVRHLDSLVARGEFRADLACALSAIDIRLPALADRLEDLPLLAQLFVEEANARGGKQVSGFTPESLDLLSSHVWPRNLDELAKVVGEAHERAQGPQIGPRDLPQSVAMAIDATARPRKGDESIDLVAFLERVERELIERALSRSKGNKSRAARLLGMTRPKLYRRLTQLKMLDGR